jgi:hypothetical protein
MHASSATTPGRRDVRGTIHRRILVNAVIDPDEAASRLPAGLRPHVTETGTVVGCCLLDIHHIRPAGVPAATGVGLRAAAHRISVEWAGASGERVVGVYVPMRHTDSRLAVVLGGRWFPGVHRPAHIAIAGQPDSPLGLTWRVDDAGGADEFGIRVTVTATPDPASEPCEPIAGTCLAATIGLSPGHTGALEGAHMAPAHRRAREVVVVDLHSAFLAGFSTATPAPSYLMEDVDVLWKPAPAPRLAEALARA